MRRAAALIDLYVVSVLLDAAAGPTWLFTETNEAGSALWQGGRSEGLAVATYHMFIEGVFSSDPTNQLQVDGQLLSLIS